MNASDINRTRDTMRRKGRPAHDATSSVAEGRYADLLVSLLQDEPFVRAVADAVARHMLAADIDPLIPLADVKRISGLGKTMIYELARKMEFPAPYKPGGAATRWSLNEIRAWRRSLKRYQP